MPIDGYTASPMEPFISPDGQQLLFIDEARATAERLAEERRQATSENRAFADLGHEE